MQKEHYEAALAKLRKTLDEYTPGWANDKARRAVFVCLREIERAAGSDDRYVSQKTSDLEHGVDRLYSARKHLSERRGLSNGVEVLRGEIQSIIAQLESWPDEKERLRTTQP